MQHSKWCWKGNAKWKNNYYRWIFGKKKEPLVLPPDYNELPKPDTLKNRQISEDDQIKKILKSSQSSQKKIDKGTTSIEKKIIDRIKSE